MKDVCLQAASLGPQSRSLISYDNLFTSRLPGSALISMTTVLAVGARHFGYNRIGFRLVMPTSHLGLGMTLGRLSRGKCQEDHCLPFTQV